jgi:hypothetical protein
LRPWGGLDVRLGIGALLFKHPPFHSASVFSGVEPPPLGEST